MIKFRINTKLMRAATMLLLMLLTTTTAWADETFTITWVDGDGETLKTEEVASGVTPVYSGATPTKTPTDQYSYTFNNTWSPEIVPVTKAATYTAQFNSTVNKYTVNFVDEDGIELSSAEYDYGTAAADIVRPADPTKAATAQYTYAFSGWSPAIAEVTGDATYTATYSSTVNEYTITWLDGNGETLKTDEVAYGETPEYSGDTPTKTATDQYTYTFNNTWSPEIVPVTGPATYTAQFDAVLITSGYCGTTGSVESVTWSYNTETKALSISGTGYMMYYNSVQKSDDSYSNGAPWKHFADEIVSVTIGNGITYVGSNTFAHCPNISNVTLPTSGIYQIGDGVFADCTSLESIDIPMSINNIGNQAFAGCDNLKTVSIGYGNPGTFTLGSDVFPATTTILVPENAFNDYVKEKAVNGESVEIDNPFYGYKDKIRPATLTFFAANATHTWSTFCAQDDYTLPEGCTAYTMASVSSGTVTLSPVDGSTISAYTPVLIKRTEGDITEAIKATFAVVGTSSNALASSEGSGYTLWGNATNTAIAEGGFTGQTAYSLYNGKFYRYEGAQAIAAHRCLLTLSPVYTAPVLTIGETTGISVIKHETLNIKSDDAWYSLDGRKLNAAPARKGVYINGGRKVVVR